jgi:hypothetical protein
MFKSFISNIINNIINWLNPYRANFWGVDVSSWNTLTEEQLLDFKNHGLSFMWIRMCNGTWEDPKFVFHASICDKLGIPYTPYAWLIPNNDPVAQANFAVKLFKEKAKSAKSFMADIEQDHVSQIDMSSPKIPAAVIYDSSVKYTNIIVTQIPYPYIIYSSPGYLNFSCPSLKPLAQKYFYANASYGANEVTVYLWDQFLNYLNHVFAPVIPWGFTNKDIDFHQFTSNLSIKNDNGKIYERLDFDSMQSDESYQKIYGNYVQPPVIPPTPAPTGQFLVTNCYTATVRSQPSSTATVVRYILVKNTNTGTPYSPTYVTVYATSNGFSAINETKTEWIGTSLLKAV